MWKELLLLHSNQLKKGRGPDNRDTTYKQWNFVMLSLSLGFNFFVPSLVLIALFMLLLKTA